MLTDKSISDLKCMQIATKLAKIPNFEKSYPEAFEEIRKSPYLTSKEKQEIVSLLNRVNPNTQSFENHFVGFK